MDRWLLDEDEALKQKLSGFSVVNPADGRIIPVEVFYRFPDSEEVTRRFPHLAIDLTEIVFDPTRAHRAPFHTVTTVQESATPLVDFTLMGDDYPLPWSLIYQIAAYSRDPRHDRQLNGILFRLFPEQFGRLDMSAQDGTVRRADLVRVERRDTLDSTNKRLYRNVFSVAISSEFYAHQVYFFQTVRKVALDFSSVVNQSVSM